MNSLYTYLAKCDSKNINIEELQKEHIVWKAERNRPVLRELYPELESEKEKIRIKSLNRTMAINLLFEAIKP